jgi:hypothetical protein
LLLTSDTVPYLLSLDFGWIQSAVIFRAAVEHLFDWLEDPQI